MLAPIMLPCSLETRKPKHTAVTTITVTQRHVELIWGHRPSGSTKHCAVFAAVVIIIVAVVSVTTSRISCVARSLRRIRI